MSTHQACANAVDVALEWRLMFEFRPETMGAVCAVVYLLSLIVFIPFAFYKDIVAATSGGGNRDVVIEDQHIEHGRYLHRFPHGKVRIELLVLLSVKLND